MGDSDDEGDPTYQVVFEGDPKKYSYLPAIDGKATATYPNKDKFEGNYKDGKRTGPGVYTFASGAKYDGEYFENKKQGYGVFTAPDGGRYVGEWLNDVRHGNGTYTYPTGDRYEGSWANGAKHGKGTYYYANIGSAISGVWSNGQCVDGCWKIHEGSAYLGSFLGNQPAGDGLFKFANGNKAAGRFVDRKFVQDTFTKPHPNEKPPPIKPADPFKKAARIVDKAVPKLDHHSSMHALKMEIPGVANFRRIGNTPIFGCGQPSLDAYRKLNDFLTEAGFEKVLSINLRQDPVVYVGQLPFTSRDRKYLDKPQVLSTELSVENVKELEDRMADNVRFASKRKGNLHTYFEEVYTTPEQPDKHENVQKSMDVKDPSEIRSITQVYEFLGEEDVAFEYTRIPVPEGRAPNAAVFDSVTALVRGAEGGALLLNDALGADRVTFAATIASLLIKDAPPEEEEADEEGEGDEGGAKKAKGPKLPPAYDENEPDLRLGQYDVVMKLVKKINGPSKEELEALRAAELEERRLAKERKAEEAAANAEKAKEAEAEAAEAAYGGEGEGEGGGDAAEGEGEAAAEEEGEKEEGGEEEKPADAEAAAEEEDTFVSKIPTEPSTLGSELKMAVDEAIDKTGAVTNLRNIILDQKKAFDAASDEAKVAIKDSALNLVQRYCYLIIYAMYVKEQEGLGEGGFEKSFFKWLEGKPELIEAMGTSQDGPLSMFNWN